MEFDTNILDILNSLPLRTLRTFAEANGLNIPADASKERIINELQSNCPGVVRDKIRGAFLIDVDVIGKDLNDELKKVVETQIAHGMKAVDSIKTLVGASVPIFGLIMLVGGAFTTVKIATIDSDLEKRQGELSKLQAKAELFVKEERAFAEASASHAVRRILPGLTEALLNFSLTSESSRMSDELRDFYDTLSDLDAASATALSNETERMRQIQESVAMLKSVVSALLTYDGLKKFQGDEKLNKIPDVVSAWREIKIPEKPAGDAFGVFAKRFLMFRSNVLGVLVYMRAGHVAPNRRKEILDEADKHFDRALTEAREIGYPFTRPLSNQALVISQRIDLLPPGESAKRYELWEKAQEKLASAVEAEASSKTRKSLLYNNQASTFQEEAHYAATHNDIKKARKSLQSAKESLDLALQLNEIHPVVYSTNAEVKAQALLLDLEGADQRAFREQTNMIVGIVKQAIRLGYGGWRGVTANEFFKSSPVLDRLRQEDTKRGGEFSKQIDEIFAPKHG